MLGELSGFYLQVRIIRSEMQSKEYHAYEKQGDDWALYPTLGGITKYLPVQGKFPLLEDEDYEGETMSKRKAWGKIFKAIGAQAKQRASKDELQDIIDELRISTEQTEGQEEGASAEDKDAEPELIVNHGYKEENGIRKIKFRVEWKTFDDPSDQTWHQMEDLMGCQKLIEDYMLNDELEPDDLIDQCVASVEEGASAEAEADVDDGFDEEHTEFLPTPQETRR